MSFQEQWAECERQAAASPHTLFPSLAERFRAEGRYAQVFEARLMEARRQLRLPLISGGPLDGVPGEARARYDETLIAAAREAGELFLAAGDIERAWPYFRAVGEHGKIRDAIAALPDADAVDGVMGVALGERVHPLKGFRMLLATHGTCRAITAFGQYPEEATRDGALGLLIDTLHGELAANLKRVIAHQEGAAPETESLTELVASRPWLFGEYDAYIDTSHLTSLIRFATQTPDRDIHLRAIEFCEYGRRLGALHQMRGDPPLDNFFEDHLIYLQGLAGERVDAAVGHFKAKLAAMNWEETGNYAAQVVVLFLLQVERPHDAIEVFELYLADADPAYLTCPRLLELCQLAGDWERAKQTAEKSGDLLSYAAACASAGRHE